MIGFDPQCLNGYVGKVGYRQFRELSRIYRDNRLLGVVCIELQRAPADLRERLVNGEYPKSLEEQERLKWISETLNASFAFIVSVPETCDHIPDSAEVYVLEFVPKSVSRRFRKLL